GIQPPLVSQGLIWFNHRRRKDQQSGPLSGVAAANQRRDRNFRNALLHRESWRSLQGMGYIGDLGLDAEPIQDVPLGIQPSRRERSVLFRTRRCHATRWKPGVSRIAGEWMGAGSA